MAKWTYDNVRAVCGIRDPQLRASVRQTLAGHGLRRCEHVSDLDGLHGHLAGGDVDLVVTTPELNGADVGAMLQDVRHGQVGENPFVIVMTLMESPSPDLARRIVDTGTDDLLLMSLLTSQLADRIGNFVVGRKPFIVTHDYVGPDRRGGERQDSATVIEVPNPVRWQVVANADQASLKEQVRVASERINVQKIKCYGQQIAYLTDRITSSYAAAGSQASILPDAVKLGDIAADLARRMTSTNFAHAAELVLSLCALGERLCQRNRNPKPAEIHILPSLARSIGRVLDEDPEAMSWTKMALVL